MPERAYLSIGEVLALLKDEFADITISKIRFLESQGLIDPERTPSGYRKFYDPDVERLRWILRQQKEHYLPLRVIKGKLSEAPSGEEADDEEDPQPPVLAAVPDPPHDGADSNGRAAAPTPEGVPAGVPAVDQAADPRPPAPPFPESLRRSMRTSPAAFLTSPEPPRHLRPPAEPTAPATPATPPTGTEDLEAGPDEEVEMTPDELGSAAGLPLAAVTELERYGLIKGQPGPGGRYYDAAALEVAKLAAGFARFGVEARHLRMWKTAADREADFYEQVVTPLRSQRSNKARRQAGETVSELAGLGARLHAALVDGAMKHLT